MIKKSKKIIYQKYLFSNVFIYILIFFFSSFALAQKTAILTPSPNAQSKKFADTFENSLSKHLSIVDLSLAESVLEIKGLETPFNLTTEDAKNLGVGIGCNFFVIIKTESLRRSTFKRAKFFESFATFYLVSTRTGRLVFWKHIIFEEDTLQQAKTSLYKSTDKIALEITNQIKSINKKELSETIENISEIPDADSPEAKGLRPPLPYKRIKPKYTALAALYNITATVDVLVDIGDDGKVLRTTIIRWAGFGLDESVIETINEMNWRPADKNGKTMPMRILLRYNFRNIETD